ncbi:prephenate-dependent tRNA uridine(34) hydroxylase TrhP [Psittacicella hinzii]|uniref:U32 family peptidase n=1 Tax=Psittacicella hinzii TaxID=2028575 RepID=A0A3A1YR12_9GAMM|nr:tRNA 5-hydroxyuridine modification protein YegQ [Psittacicella hinzii]RIY40612.1 U32 family peptidase [Psittacicella hinzii]
MTTFAKPELLSPAGSLKNMRYAFAYGADAVYAGQPRYSLRVRNNEFNWENLEIGINEAHALGKKFYIVVNIAPHNAKLKTFIKDMERVVAMKPDAFILSDPGLIMLMHQYFPEAVLHLSVQANAVNWAACKFWYDYGVSRVILSRELSLDEIEEIRQHVPELELEVFVHGALCMAYSGRCLLSGYINKRDPNQGTCTNACRWQYDLQEGQEDELGQIVERVAAGETVDGREEDPNAKLLNSSADDLKIAVNNVEPTLGIGQPTNKTFLITEPRRPDEKMTAFEDEHGTYIMNSRDLRAIQHIPRLTQMGVHSVKIEGRTKSFFYCARTAQIYRQAIDDAAAGKELDPSLIRQLDSLAHRGYTDGFLQRHTHDQYQHYVSGNSTSDFQQFVGAFTGERQGNLALVEVKNKFKVGDFIEIMTPKGNKSYRLEKMFNRKMEPTDVAPGDGHKVWLEVDPEMELEYALVLRYLEDGLDTTDPHGRKAAANANINIKELN